MNTINNIHTTTHANNTDTTSAANARIFAFRSECMADAESIRALVLPWLLSWQACIEPLDVEGRFYRQPDVEVTFSLCEGAPQLPMLRWLVDGLLNCHIAAETLELAEHYTGEREPRPAWTGPVERPAQDVLLAATQALVNRHKLLETELERSRHMYRTLRAPYDLAARWTPPAEPQASPGWVAIANLPGTDLQRVVRVTAMAGASAKSGKAPSREVEQRMRVING